MKVPTVSQLSIRLRNNLSNSLAYKVYASFPSLSHHLLLCLWITMEGQEKTLQQVQVCWQAWWSGRAGSWWVPMHEHCLTGVQARGAGNKTCAGLTYGSCYYGSWTDHGNVDLHLLVVISSIRINIFILTGKNYSWFAVLHEEHYWKVIVLM